MRRALTDAEREQRSLWMRQAWAEGRFANRRKGMHPRAWTREQDDTLAQLVGSMPIEEVVEALNRRFWTTRTVHAVTNRVKDLGLSRWVRAYGLIEIERIFAVDHRVIVKHWVEPGHLAGRRWAGRGPNQGWWFEPAEVERFVRECGWLYDVGRMRPGHRLTRLGELAYRQDPWLTYQDLAKYLGLSSEVNLDRWRARGFVPHKRRPKSGPGQRIMVRGRDFPAIRAAIEAARAQGIAQQRERFTARAQARSAEAALRVAEHAGQLVGSCRNGHPRTIESTLITPAGRVACRECRAERRAEKRRPGPLRFTLRVVPITDVDWSRVAV